MLAEGYRVTAEYQATHWWYRSRRELFLRQVERAARELDPSGRRLRLLDYGCATGFDLEALARWGDAEGADVTTPEAVAVRRKGSFPIHELPQALPSLRGRFDIVTCLDVLEHVDDDVAGLRELAGLLRPGGQIVITLPAYAWLWSGEDEISQHRRRYTLRGLRRTCAAAGLEVRWASYFNLAILPAMTAVVWSRRLLRSDWRSESNLTAGGSWAEGLLRAVTGLEARVVGDERLRLPAGASLVARARPASG